MKLDIHLTGRDGGHRLQPIDAAELRCPYIPRGGPALIIVQNGTECQEIEGFGGAFTEAASSTLDRMPAEKREEALRAYFDPETGHGYSLCRSHINSCDFSLGNYAYCERDGDFELESFSIERDRQSLLPMIRRARELAGEKLRLMASPWSPPAWMKTTGQMNLGGKLREDCRDAWARYYVRYIEEYEKEGIPIWGVTVQNEPAATQTWDSCVYTGEEERDFVRDHLGPAFYAAGRQDVRIIVWDHNRDLLFERARAVYDDAEAARFVWGTGFHWYGEDAFEQVQRTHDAWPDKKLLFTEGCQEGVDLFGSWLLGERYARSIIQDLNHWTVGWMDWNLVLDETGGPNHVGNLCAAPIIADTRTGELHYQSSYYYLGHFSRFIRPGARRLISSSTRDALEVVACRNPDGAIVTVVLNRSEKALPFELKVGGEVCQLTSPARSILTLVAA